ncbi:TPA: metallophosphoesterase [Stenotrophomonas maltophilia]|nr:metallophosphoesterase [Stenotrophomonas maltophilia]
MPVAVQALFSGPIDLVGDIHGEIEALDTLIARLGYDRDGRHPRGRRLVFCGDLIDRGQDSPATVERVAGIVGAGYGQAVLGNHELNLVLGKAKEGNGWAFEVDHDQAHGHFMAAARLTSERRRHVIDWLASLPVVLERPDLRVVHACWDPTAVDSLRGDTRPLRAIHQHHADRLNEVLRETGQLQAREAEIAAWRDRLHDRAAVVPFLPAIAHVDSVRQTGHPLKVITSGIERPTGTPFFASGKWRMTERVAWWHEYDDEPAVVMGHYWRWPGDESAAAARSRGPNLFENSSPESWLGPRQNVMCIDWCAGLRWRERTEGIRAFTGRLGALRWPEREIVYDC